MKPSLNMDSKQELPQTVVEGVNTQRPKMIKRAVIAIVSVVVIAVVIGLSVFLGVKFTRETYKEAWQTFKTADGKTVEEKVTVTDDSVDVKVPNEMEVIYDYKHGLMVQRFVNDKTGLYGPCYASYINDSLAAKAQDVMDGLDETDIDLPETSNVVKGNVKFTEDKVPRYMISKEVEEMCADTEIYWMEYDDSTVDKRSVTCAYKDYDDDYYCLHFTAGFSICIYFFHCYDNHFVHLGYYYETRLFQ